VGKRSFSIRIERALDERITGTQHEQNKAQNGANTSEHFFVQKSLKNAGFHARNRV
jgi:hypothetical protein